MKEKIMVSILSNLVPILLRFLTPEMVKSWVTSGLDSLEKQIQESPNQYDDAVLPLIQTIRLAIL